MLHISSCCRGKRLSRCFGPRAFYVRALCIALPVMLHSFIQTGISFLDNVMVSRLGDVKMGAVNVVNSLLFLYVTALMTVSNAGSVFMTQYSGARHVVGMRQSYRFKQYAMGSLALGAMAAALCCPQYLLSCLLGKNAQAAQIIAEGERYLSIIVYTLVPLSFSLVLTSTLRETGKVLVPLAVYGCSAVLNAVGNYMLIYGNWGAPRLEVQGAACATLIALVVESLMLLVYVRVKKPDFYVRLFCRCAIPLSLCTVMLRKSLWIFVGDMAWSVTEMAVAALYHSRGGAEVVAGMSAGWTLAQLFFLSFPASSVAITILVGDVLGKSELKQAQDYARWLMNGAFFLGLGLGVIVCVARAGIPWAFGDLSHASQRIAQQLVLVTALYMPIWMYLNAQYAVARAGGEVMVTAWTETLVDTLLFLPLMYVLARFTQLGAPLMYGIVKSTSVVKMVVLARHLKTRRWVRNLVANLS